MDDTLSDEAIKRWGEISVLMTTVERKTRDLLSLAYRDSHVTILNLQRVVDQGHPKWVTLTEWIDDGGWTVDVIRLSLSSGNRFFKACQVKTNDTIIAEVFYRDAINRLGVYRWNL